MYDIIAQERALPQWPDLSKQHSYSLLATDLMAPHNGVHLTRYQTCDTLASLLKQAHDLEFFPMVDSSRNMLYLGVVTRKDLIALLQVWNHVLQKETTSDLILTSTLSEGQYVALCSPVSEFEQPVDLIQYDLLDISASNIQSVRSDVFCSTVLLMMAVHNCSVLYVTTTRGKLVGVIHTGSLLARKL